MKTVHGKTGKQVLKVTTTYTITLRKVYNGSETHVEVVKRNINVTPGPPSEAEIAKAKAQLKLAGLSEVDSVNAKLLNLAAVEYYGKKVEPERGSKGGICMDLLSKLLP